MGTLDISGMVSEGRGPIIVEGPRPSFAFVYRLSDITEPVPLPHRPHEVPVNCRLS